MTATSTWGAWAPTWAPARSAGLLAGAVTLGAAAGLVAGRPAVFALAALVAVAAGLAGAWSP